MHDASANVRDLSLTKDFLARWKALGVSGVPTAGQKV